MQCVFWTSFNKIGKGSINCDSYKCPIIAPADRRTDSDQYLRTRLNMLHSGVLLKARHLMVQYGDGEGILACWKDSLFWYNRRGKVGDKFYRFPAFMFPISVQVQNPKPREDSSVCWCARRQAGSRRDEQHLCERQGRGQHKQSWGSKGDVIVTLHSVFPSTAQ